MKAIEPQFEAVFGLPPAKPFRTDLPGLVRLRLRNDEFAIATIRHGRTTRRFIIVDAGDHWTVTPEWEQGSNVTPA